MLAAVPVRVQTGRQSVHIAEFLLVRQTGQLHPFITRKRANPPLNTLIEAVAFISITMHCKAYAEFGTSS